MTASITQSTKGDSRVPSWMVWVQCIAFIVLYAVWILPEIVGFRNTALVVGSIFGIYSIYQYREFFLKKSALPIWLIATLFAWATFHLYFLGPNYTLQYTEYYRIWKYAALGAIMATGLGLSVTSSRKNQYWGAIYFGICTPMIIYLIKYVFTWFGRIYGLDVPSALQIYESSQPFYVPKTDYVAFCLPAFSVALGSLIRLSHLHRAWRLRDLLSFMSQILIISGTLFLFAAQNIKNGMVYAAMLFIIGGVIYFSGHASKLTWKKIVGLLLVFVILISAIAVNVKKNDSWRTLIADTKIGLSLDQYPNWKDAVKYGYPLNEYGSPVSPTNYERVAWALVGVQLSLEKPLGYGLVEDSFARMAKAKWPDVGPNLSHSHSGWLDVILAIGYPGFFLVLCALLVALKNALRIKDLSREFAFWPLLANLLLWVTTEVSATVTFASLIFWICLGGALGLKGVNDPIKSS